MVAENDGFKFRKRKKKEISGGIESLINCKVLGTPLGPMCNKIRFRRREVVGRQEGTGWWLQMRMLEFKVLEAEPFLMMTMATVAVQVDYRGGRSWSLLPLKLGGERLGC